MTKGSIAPKSLNEKVVNRDSLSFCSTLTLVLTCIGPRYVVQVGDKVIDYNEDFRLFMATRNPTPIIPPDAVSVVTEVNFTTTRAGLRGQVIYVHAHSNTNTYTVKTTSQAVHVSSMNLCLIFLLMLCWSSFNFALN